MLSVIFVAICAFILIKDTIAFLYPASEQHTDEYWAQYAKDIQAEFDAVAKGSSR
jgi:hypothetical protein